MPAVRQGRAASTIGTMSTMSTQSAADLLQSPNHATSTQNLQRAGASPVAYVSTNQMQTIEAWLRCVQDHTRRKECTRDHVERLLLGAGHRVGSYCFRPSSSDSTAIVMTMKCAADAVKSSKFVIQPDAPVAGEFEEFGSCRNTSTDVFTSIHAAVASIGPMLASTHGITLGDCIELRAKPSRVRHLFGPEPTASSA